jgi:hypothetical protein
MQVLQEFIPYQHTARLVERSPYDRLERAFLMLSHPVSSLGNLDIPNADAN